MAKFREPDVVKIDPYLRLAKLREWKIHIHIRILAEIGGTQRGMAWHSKIEASLCQDDLKNPDGFISLDFKLAAAMLTVVEVTEWNSQIQALNTAAQKLGSLLKGR